MLFFLGLWSGRQPTCALASVANVGTGSEEGGKEELQGRKVSMGTGGAQWVWGEKAALAIELPSQGPLQRTLQTLSESRCLGSTARFILYFVKSLFI